MFKRCNAANAVFRGQPKGLVAVDDDFPMAWQIRRIRLS